MSDPISALARPLSRLSGAGRLVVLGSAARVFALVSQLVVLLVMSWMLPKAAFGEAMIVFTLYRLVSLGLGTGLGNLLLFRVGRQSGDPGLDARLLRSVSLLGMGLSGTIAGAAALLAAPIASVFSKPEMAPWLLHMAPMILFGTMNLITAGSYDSRSRITASILLTEVVPNGLRLAGFPLVALWALPDIAIAHVLWLSLALPWAVDSLRLFSGRWPGFEPLSGADLRYAGWFTIYPMATQQLQGVDMLIVGALFSSTVAADYALASRLATYFPFLQYILIRGFAPLAGTLHQRGDIAGLNAALARLKRQSILLVCLSTGLILLAAPLGLPLFGDFSGALPILLALAAPAVVRSIFSGSDAVLKMIGRAGFSSMVALLSVGLIVALSWLLAPWIGIHALPLAMLASALLFNPLMAWMLGREGIVVLGARDIAWLVLPAAGLALALALPGDWPRALAGGGALIGTALAARLSGHGKEKLLTMAE
ncbi:MAG: hypothetical protein ABS76_31800 [Pelagibacterium sp. SCN 64-44]|nr:MAG: hypothetical protein ABS76_31800 [Pelagibacterium sp. SCN 64-44]